MTRKQSYYARHRERLNAERRERRKSPEAKAREAAAKREWRAKNRQEYKLIMVLGVTVGKAREMISAFQ